MTDRGGAYRRGMDAPRTADLTLVDALVADSTTVVDLALLERLLADVVRL